jgi:hypothetical protein
MITNFRKSLDNRPQRVKTPAPRTDARCCCHYGERGQKDAGIVLVINGLVEPGMGKVYDFDTASVRELKEDEGIGGQ